MNAPTEAAFSLSRQREVVAALREQLPAHAVLFNEEDTRPYECDGLSAYRQLPMIVTLPENEAQVIAVLKVCHRLNVQIATPPHAYYVVYEKQAAERPEVAAFLQWTQATFSSV